MAMNERDRLNDARADQNLADVERIPAPWDARPPEAVNHNHQIVNLGVAVTTGLGLRNGSPSS
jgi:serine/threonine-protein kinase ULK/ATG1